MFKHIYDATNTVRQYSGDPDCTAAYEWILQLLRDTTADWLSSPAAFSDRVKGNIGEFVAFHLSRPTSGPAAGWYIFYSNADSPLSRNSASGLDIAYLYLGANESGDDDRLVIQEVKTTGAPDLAYANALVDDHEKLCSTDPNLNLQSRVRAIKARLRDMYSLPPDVRDRVQRIAHPTPSKCEKVTFLPTLVHEKIGADPASVMASVRTKIAGQGWQIKRVAPISVALSQLDKGLGSLACNRPFQPK